MRPQQREPQTAPGAHGPCPLCRSSSAPASRGSTWTRRWGRRGLCPRRRAPPSAPPRAPPLWRAEGRGAACLPIRFAATSALSRTHVRDVCAEPALPTTGTVGAGESIVSRKRLKGKCFMRERRHEQGGEPPYTAGEGNREFGWDCRVQMGKWRSGGGEQGLRVSAWSTAPVLMPL